MADELPQGPDGGRGCEWCGGPVVQPAQGRRRKYCKQGCREMAYRARSTQRRVDDALRAAGAVVAEQSLRTTVSEARELCPYCMELLPDLVPHLGVCPERPDSSVDGMPDMDFIS